MKHHRRSARRHGAARSARARAVRLSGGVLAVTLVPAAAAHAQQTITVTTLTDSGAGSLRSAITTADSDNTTPSTLDTITFASQLSGSINLLTPLPAITDSIDIQGPGARVMTLNAAGIPNGSGSVISDSSGVLTISGLAMDNATQGSADGGFLDVTYAGAVTLTDDSFSHDAAAFGGAVFDGYNSYGPLTVTGSTFSHDASSNHGGAIYSYAPLTISDSTIYDNSSPYGGGLGAGGSTTITGSTIDDNSASRNGGGGIDSYNSLTLQDTIVAGNSSPDPASDDIRGVNPASRTASYSLIQTAPSNLSVNSSDVTGVSPDLGPLANNGGQTDTQLPASSSPVIDQGKAFGLNTDQRGLARTVIYPAKTAPTGGDHTDIGATELQTVTVSGVSPATGVAGSTVQITGSGFTGATAVTFAGTPATSFTVTDDGHITATVPAGAGTEDVRVTTPRGESSASTSDQFSYLPAVTGVSPASGAAGATVQITGSGFTGATAVTFAGTPATSFTVTDDGHITATVPAGAGTEDVRVTTPDGQSAVATSDEFSYLPAVTGISPSSGAEGTSVQITGSGFTGATAVTFAGTPATSFTVTDDGHITATVPAGTGTEDVRVTTADGQSAASSSDQFSYPQQSTTSTTSTTTTSTTTTTTATTPTITTTTSTTATTAAPTTPTTTAPTAPTTATTPTPPAPPVQPRITAISSSETTITWCQGVGCRYPATSLRFSLNRATTIRLVLLARAHGQYTQVATTKLLAHQGINHDRIAGRWHGHLFPARPVQILVQIQHNHRWTTTKTIGLTVRHTRRQG